MMTATYSPDDNKLRLYASSRLDRETYDQVKSAGFIWAAKQGLFVAPMWTPEREDLLIELCGEISDDDTSLTDRAEERADRFDGYRERRAEDAEAARLAVSAIADHIPLGQPILIGHHSERHARKDAARIENGMRLAIKMWKTSQYWQARAAGAIRHAKYKELPGVRARRIKTIEAERRRNERAQHDAETWLKLWTACGLDPDQERQQRTALKIAGMCWLHLPLKAGDKEGWTQQPTAYDALTGSYPNLYAPRTLADVLERAEKVYPRTIANCARWIAHCDHRLEYERAMLEGQGASDLLKPKPKSAKAQLPLCNYRASEGLTIENQWNRGQMIHYPQIEMTQAAYAAIHADYKGTRVVAHSHRVRTTMQRSSLVCVFLTDSKAHVPPEAKEAPARRPIARDHVVMPQAPPADQATTFAALAETLKAGVQVVTAPQLFPTPTEIARQIVALAGIEPGMRVLEPSAGTGRLIGAMGCRWLGHNPEAGALVAVEINEALGRQLRQDFPLTDVRITDFLSCNGDLGTFDRIVMNPPFERGSDIRHILHARTLLKPGGRLVAICARGSRQVETLQPIALDWIDLPAGTFKDQGTNVQTAIVIIDAEVAA
jgi:hypothetical protein